MLIKKIIRKILKGTFLYAKAAKVYHYNKKIIMKISLLFSSVIYLPPRKTIGKYKSQFGQDYYLEHFGLISERGYFVEIGCNHPINGSNSYYLEKCLDWTGVSIDGIDYSILFSEHRINTTFVNLLVDTHIGELDFYEVKNIDGWEDKVSSIYKKSLTMGKGFEAEVKRIKTMPISGIKEIIRPIDLLLLDVEGHEFSVLDSIDWQKQAPSVAVIENNGEFFPRKKLVNYMKKKHYKHFARIGTVDDIFVHNNHIIFK